MSFVSAGAITAGRPAAGERPQAAALARLPTWWPLAALTLLAAALRLSTLGLQSFWYDEAFTPVHVLHASLASTLSSVAHSENTPPLWYLLAWADSRVLGDGEVALRLPSALAGIALVPVAWEIGRELAGRRVALASAALIAVNPLFVWYSQEARSYELFALTSALAMLCFVRAERTAPGDPACARRMAAFAAAGALALLTHYFAVFLLAPMALWLLRPRGRRAAALPAIGALALVGLALVPLIAAQGGHGTQWIGRWPLAERIEAIPQYFLTGASGAPLGHGVELLVALPLLVGLLVGAWRLLEAAAAPRRAALLAALPAACGVLIPVILVAFGADYLAPRNLIGAMVPLTVLIAVLMASGAAGRAGALATVVLAIGFLAVSLDVDLSPRLQRGDWRSLARAIPRGGVSRAVTTVELGTAPLQYYIAGLHELHPHTSVLLSEIDETGYSPLRASAGAPPAAGFTLLSRSDVNGLILYRFVSPRPRAVTEEQLRRHVITLERPAVLVPAGASVIP